MPSMTQPAPAETIRTPDPLKPFVSMSSRDRWSACALSAVLPQVRTPSGPAAVEGTLAHSVAEWALAQQFGIGPKTDAPEVTPPEGLYNFDYSEAGIANWRATVLEHATTYATRAASLFASDSCKGHPTFAMIELKIEDVMIEGVRVYTVADSVFWNPGPGRLVVGDYKYGSSPVGVGTATDPNPQVAGATVLWADKNPNMDIREIGQFVYQPRTRFGDPWQVLAPLGPDWLEAERAKLRAELAAVAHAAKEMAEGRQVPGVPGDHCKYCPSARWCNTAAGYGAQALAVERNKRAVVDMTPDEVMALWGARQAFKQFEDDLRERVRMLHETGHAAVATKRRKGNVVWARPDVAVEQLMIAGRYDLLNPPAVSVAEQSGAIAPEVFSTLTTRAPDVITYAPANGKDVELASAAFAKYLPSPFAE